MYSVHLQITIINKNKYKFRFSIDSIDNVQCVGVVQE